MTKIPIAGFGTSRMYLLCGYDMKENDVQYGAYVKIYGILHPDKILLRVQGYRKDERHKVYIHGTRILWILSISDKEIDFEKGISLSSPQHKVFF